MRDIYTMTHEQVLALTQEEITRIYDFMCADAGLRFVDFPTEPEKQVFTPDDIVYEVGEIYTQDIEVAQKLSAILVECRDKLVKIDYNYRVGSDYKYLKKNLEEYDYKAEIKTHRTFKAATYEYLQAAMEKFREAKDAYEKQKKDYDEYTKKRTKITEQVSQKINGHYKLQWKLEEYQRLMQKYIDLANGDKQIALNFFKKALAEKEWGPSEQWFLYKMGYLDVMQPDGSYLDTSGIEERAIAECGGY